MTACGALIWDVAIAMTRSPAYLDSIDAPYSKLGDEALMPKLAEILDSEKVVGWFSGRMEFGPRALGGRSIIGDPRSPKMQSIMNLKIKYRESFRPFAPAVKAELCQTGLRSTEKVPICCWLPR